MTYTIDFDESIATVRLTHSGYIEIIEYQQARNESARILESHGTNRLLVDVKGVKNNPNTATHFEFTSKHLEVFSYKTKIAVVMLPDSAQTNRFIENIAINRSINLRTFHEVESAIEWLVST